MAAQCNHYLRVLIHTQSREQSHPALTSDGLICQVVQPLVVVYTPGPICPPGLKLPRDLQHSQSQLVKVPTSDT
jgi:hypothetical protein